MSTTTRSFFSNVVTNYFERNRSGWSGSMVAHEILQFGQFFGVSFFPISSCRIRTSGRTHSLLVRRAAGISSRSATAHSRAAGRTTFGPREAAPWSQWGLLWTAISSWWRESESTHRNSIAQRDLKKDTAVSWSNFFITTVVIILWIYTRLYIYVWTYTRVHI